MTDGFRKAVTVIGSDNDYAVVIDAASFQISDHGAKGAVDLVHAIGCDLVETGMRRPVLAGHLCKTVGSALVHVLGFRIKKDWTLVTGLPIQKWLQLPIGISKFQFIPFLSN